jgi:transcription antitermination factor NusG
MSDVQTAPAPRSGASAPCDSSAQNQGLIKRGRGGPRPGAGRKLQSKLPGRLEALRWFCARTEFDRELLADIEIRLAGFEVFAPTIWKPATVARRSANGVLRAALPDRIVPLFRRYLFVRFRRDGDDWRQIRHFPNVAVEILGTTPETPTPMPDAAIALIRSLPGMAMNNCLYPPNVELRAAGPVVHLPPGSNVRLLEGPLADLTGICQWSNDRRVRLLLSLLGREVFVTVPRTAVEVA